MKDELSPLGIVKLIDLTISCSLHRLSYDEGGFVSGWDKFGDEEKQALLDEIKDDTDWKRLIKNCNVLDDLVGAVTTPDKNEEEIVQALKMMMDSAVEFVEYQKEKKK